MIGQRGTPVSSYSSMETMQNMSVLNTITNPALIVYNLMLLLSHLKLCGSWGCESVTLASTSLILSPFRGGPENTMRDSIVCQAQKLLSGARPGMIKHPCSHYRISKRGGMLSPMSVSKLVEWPWKPETYTCTLCDLSMSIPAFCMVQIIFL